jgi:hypothetical protein
MGYEIGAQAPFLFTLSEGEGAKDISLLLLY